MRGWVGETLFQELRPAINKTNFQLLVIFLFKLNRTSNDIIAENGRIVKAYICGILFCLKIYNVKDFFYLWDTGLITEFSKSVLWF